MNAPVSLLAANWRNTLASLREQFPDADDQTLFDTCDGLTEAADVVVEFIRSAREDEAQIVAIKSMEEALAARKARFQRRLEKKRDAAQALMENMGRKRIDAPDVTVFLKATQRSVVVYDEKALPPEYVRTSVEPDKKLLSAALRNGASIPGASLSNSRETISVSDR